MPRVEQQICGGEQFENPARAVRCFRIGYDAFLVGVEPRKGDALALPAADIGQRGNAAAGIAALRFDLDDLRAEIRKQFAAIAERIARSEFNDAEVERGVRTFDPCLLLALFFAGCLICLDRAIASGRPAKGWGVTRHTVVMAGASPVMTTRPVEAFAAAPCSRQQPSR
jgi:hypothetical protein